MQTLTRWLGLEAPTTSQREKLLAALGAGLGIAAVYELSSIFLPSVAAGWMVASMGASAVLLFAVPHGRLSQPWQVIVGHLLSAAIGVSCQKWLGEYRFAPALAVGLAVGAMCYARCVHPPGGATALAAVIGGEPVHALGYAYLVTPVAVNLAAIVAVALVFNNLFHWRRYPVAIMAQSKTQPQDEDHLALAHEDLAAAMHELDTYVDVSSEELSELFERAWAHAHRAGAPLTWEKGRYYSNGASGSQWCVRQIWDLPDGGQGAQLIYKNVAGPHAGETGVCFQREFADWAAFEVVPYRSHWVRASAKGG